MSSSTASKDNAGWEAPYTITGPGEKTITFLTENKFVDADVRVTLTTPAASSPSLSLADNSGSLSMGTASNGVYTPTATFTGSVGFTNAGWTAASINVSDSGVAVGTVNQSTMVNGSSAIASGSTITPGPSDQVITISEGYNTARTLTIGAASGGTPGAVTSGSALITSLAYSYDSSNSQFNISGAADVSAPTVGTAGYVSGSIGTLNANTGGALVGATVAEISIKATLSGQTTAKKPTLSRDAISITGVVDAAKTGSSASTTAPSSGAYIAVHSVAATDTITATPSVYSAGYGTTSNYDVNSTASAIVGAAQSNVHYIQIEEGTVTSGTATITSASFEYNSTSGDFDISGSADVSAPTFTAGYIASTVGTKSGVTGGAVISASAPKISIKSALSGQTTAAKPTLSKGTVNDLTTIDASDGDITTTEPEGYAAVAIYSNANTGTITSTPSVYSAGYGTTTNYGVNGSATATVGAAQSDVHYIKIKSGTVTSGSANITSTSIAYNSSNSNFDITGSSTVDPPTYTEGYIANGVGIKYSNTATLTSTLPKIEIAAAMTGEIVSGGTAKVTPVIIYTTDSTASNASALGTITTTKPQSGYYATVRTQSITKTVTATPSVTTAGYGTTTNGQYTKTTSQISVGANASGSYYIPLEDAVLANTATPDVTYEDISSTAPVLISGSYLFINEGYMGNSKISLAHLVPDGASASLSGDYILSGYSAYDNDGVLVAGSIQTYGGAYTIV